MTEYDFSPEAYEGFIKTQERVSKWASQTESCDCLCVNPYARIRPRHKCTRHPQQPQQPAPEKAASRPDPFYDHEYISKICSRFITHLFSCPVYPTPKCNASVSDPYLNPQSTTLSCLSPFQSPTTQQIDARGGTFNDVGGDQHNNVYVFVNQDSSKNTNHRRSYVDDEETAKTDTDVSLIFSIVT